MHKNTKISHNSNSKEQSIKRRTAASPAVTLHKRRTPKPKSKENRSNTSTPVLSTTTTTIETLSKQQSHDSDYVTVKELSCDYYINIAVDGQRHMDQPNHLSDEQVDSLCLERKLRPISGLKHRIRPNNETVANVIEDTDFIDRLSRITTMKWLDLSSNNLNKYPKKLCSLELLEKLELSNNKLTEKEIPNELEKYQNLLEIVLDSNCLNDLPKCLVKFKKLMRLSVRNNSLTSLKLLDNLRKLRYLIVDFNKLTQIDESLYMLDRLEMLHLSNNQISIIKSAFLQANLNHLKQMDLSFNNITFIPTEIFTLPHLDVLNMSNNKLIKLPILPVTFKRTTPINFIDFSTNNLTKFYEYLLSIGVHIDVSTNRIKCIPSTTIRNLNMEQIKKKSLKLDMNPIEYPPLDICLNGLKIMKLFFEEAATKMHLKHGFKISIIGDVGSGKTSLAYAIEDYHAQSNLIEHLSSQITNISNIGIDIPQDIQEKFIEAHEFFFKNKDEKPVKPIKNVKSTKTDTLKPIVAMPVSIFDINGSAKQFGHLNHVFIDKTSLVVLCIDITTFDESLDSCNLDLAEKNLKYWLDLIFFKLSRTCAMYILPVCTKCDFYYKSHKNQMDAKEAIRIKTEINEKLKSISSLILSKIYEHFDTRLSYVKFELEQIESQAKISASESDRLKRFANVFNYSKPGLHTECLVTSSYTMEGIEHLNDVIRDIVCNNEKYFPHVNKRIPGLWNEVDNYVFSWLNHLQKTGFTNDSMRISSYSLSSINVLCMDFDEYKERITEKYGMDRMVGQITNFFNSQGKLLWLQDTLQWRTKVFFNLNILFDFVYTLFKKDFENNFTNNQFKIIRTKLSLQTQNNLAYIQRLKNDLLRNGCAHIDLLKFIWTPVMLNTSSKLLIDISILLMAFFNIGYPQVPKNQMRQIFADVPFLMKMDYANKPIVTTIKQRFGSDEDLDMNANNRVSFVDNMGRSITTQVTHDSVKANDTDKTKTLFDTIMIPFYMPKIENLNKLGNIRDKLKKSSESLTSIAFSLSHSSNDARLVPFLGMKYTFLWSLVSGIFERFSVNCILNTELYYKMHWKDAIYAHNEQDTMAVLIYLQESSETQVTDVYFEFYLIEFLVSQVDSEESSKNELPEPSTLMLDFESLWNLAMQILTLFEETLSTLPTMIFDKFSQCPECLQFSFLGEWSTPKESQNLKTKKCKNCENDVDTMYLVRPPSGKNLALQLKRMKRRLQNLVQMRTESAKIRSKARRGSGKPKEQQKDGERRKRSSSRDSRSSSQSVLRNKSNSSSLKNSASIIKVASHLAATSDKP